VTLSGANWAYLKVQVRINRHVAEADVAIVVGPVFPHDVVGFSGGNKYFFPGVSGPELIDLSHWVGALITSAAMIGTRGVTPVRALINEAATMIPAERLALCLVLPPAPTPCTRRRSARRRMPGRLVLRSLLRPTSVTWRRP
jgi:nickel-dependent lactate racemase